MFRKLINTLNLCKDVFLMRVSAKQLAGHELSKELVHARASLTVIPLLLVSALLLLGILSVNPNTSYNTDNLEKEEYISIYDRTYQGPFTTSASNYNYSPQVHKDVSEEKHGFLADEFSDIGIFLLYTIKFFIACVVGYGFAVLGSYLQFYFHYPIFIILGKFFRFNCSVRQLNNAWFALGNSFVAMLWPTVVFLLIIESLFISLSFAAEFETIAIIIVVSIPVLVFFSYLNIIKQAIEGTWLKTLWFFVINVICAVVYFSTFPIVWFAMSLGWLKEVKPLASE